MPHHIILRWYCTGLCCAVLYCTVLYYTLLLLLHALDMTSLGPRPDGLSECVCRKNRVRSLDIPGFLLVQRLARMQPRAMPCLVDLAFAVDRIAGGGRRCAPQLPPAESGCCTAAREDRSHVHPAPQTRSQQLSFSLHPISHLILHIYY